MIDFERLERELPVLTKRFRDAAPFPHLTIDEFCHSGPLHELARQIPSPEDGSINKSRDYVFAKNKFEKSSFRELGPLFEEIYQDLLSERFQRILRAITGEPVTVDAEFHGGGIHQGGENSFLDMHVDFSHHPMHPELERHSNVLLYLNDGWQPSWGGELQLRHKATGETGKVEPLFNRCCIMRTREFTLHGYHKLEFPKGRYRRSIATYAYVPATSGSEARSVVWFPENGSVVKRVLGQSWPALVRLKTKFLGSGTARNR